MAIGSVTDLLKNIKGGPKTTLVGALLIVLSGYMMYSNDFTVTYTSIEIGMLGVGIYLFVINDNLKIDEDEGDIE